MSTNISILDTGKLSTTSSSATETRAYGDSGVGTALGIKGVDVTFNINSMTSDDSPILKRHSNIQTSYFDWGEADNTGVELPVWIIRGYLSRSSEADMITLGRLIFMCRTAGYKQLYSSNDTNFLDIIAYSHYGQRESDSETTKTVSYINVRTKSLNVQQTADKKGFNFTLNLVETA